MDIRTHIYKASLIKDRGKALTYVSQCLQKGLKSVKNKTYSYIKYEKADTVLYELWQTLSWIPCKTVSV